MAQSYSNLFGSNRREPQAVVVTTNVSGALFAGNVTQLVSGTTGGSDTNNAIIFTTGGVSSNGKYFQFLFPKPVIISELTLYQSGGFDEGDFNLDVSNNGSTWTTLASFTWNSATQVVATGNLSHAYSYMRIIGTNGAKTFSVFPWLFEAQFKIDGSALEFGNRTGTVTVTTTLSVNTGSIANTVNGDEDASDVVFNETTVTGKDITFDFGATSVIMTGINPVLANNSANYGTYKMQYWNGSVWTDIAGAAFTVGGNTPNNGSIPFSEMHTWTNSVSATKYRMLGTAGTNNDGGNSIHEFNFMFAGSPAYVPQPIMQNVTVGW